MLNVFSLAVHQASSDNFVIGGALFPNGLRRKNETAIAPLEFTRDVFCLSGGPHPRRVCQTKVNIDAWSVHPYTTGGPSTPPANPDNVWIYNLGALNSLVRAAQRLGTLVSSHPAQTWVTEFSWDSNPPDPQGVPVGLEQRWVAESLYRSWTANVSVFAWFSLRDEPLGQSPFQAGMYFACSLGVYCDTPKPAGAAFHFPFVAFATGRRKVLVWGRTPTRKTGKVQIQWLQGRRWRRLTTLRTDGNGIFIARRRLPRGANAKSALIRATRDAGETSPSFSLHKPPDIAVTPFGS
jgi:hypothetical protein